MQRIYRRFLLQTAHQETGISYALFWLKERKKICDGFSPGFDEAKLMRQLRDTADRMTSPILDLFHQERRDGQN